MKIIATLTNMSKCMTMEKESEWAIDNHMMQSL